jgi:extracellular factor (EF) 3-hydroxypalmitic acid methyl ester biosynthesis protein
MAIVTPSAQPAASKTPPLPAAKPDAVATVPAAHAHHPLALDTRTTVPGVRSSPGVLSLQENLHALLDHAWAQVHAGRALAGYRLLGTPLSALWSEARGCGRADEMLAWCRQHPLHALAQQDPYTQRATLKPRGYAGDAVMMDYIYQGTPPPGTSALGAEIFGATTRVSMGLSVLYRRQLLKSLIDDAVVSVDAARVLSVASGHARELEGSLVQSPHFQGEFFALDQDPLSCQEVQRVHAGGRVHVINEGVRDLLSPERGAALGCFDLIYSAGLYDYLPDVLARRLTQRLLQLLAPGGRLVIANFVPGGSGRGYMELFMDWTLVLRTEVQMRELAQAAGAAQVHSFLDPHRNVVYAELLREAAA